MDKNIIKKHLNLTFLSEETVPGISVTASAKKESGKFNKDGVKAIEKDVAAFEKNIKADKDAKGMAQNKFNYDDDFEKTYHDEMEIMNGQEMLQYDSKPNDTFKKRAEEGMSGSAQMGNEGGIGNAEAAWGASSDDFGKNLVKRVKDSSKKRNEQTPTLNLRGQNIQADMKDHGNRPYALSENNNNQEIKIGVNNRIKEDLTQQVSTGDGWDAKTKSASQGNLTLNSYAKKLYSLFKKEGAKTLISSTGFRTAGDLQGNQVGIDTATTNGEGIKITLNIGQNSMAMANKYGPMILKTFPDLELVEQPKEIGGWGGTSGVEFTLKPKQGTNLTENKQSNITQSKIKEGMKRLKFKKEFNGVGNALNMIPESYRVDNKQFEMTDGNETYKIRWEGNLTEGRAVVLMASDKRMVNEDMAHMKHLMGYKSQETLGTVKGKARLTENAVFGDIFNKSKALLEGTDIESAKAKTGNLEDIKKKAPEASKHIQGSVSKDKGTQAPSAKEGDLDDAVSHAAEAKKHVEGSVSTEKGTKAPAPKKGEWEAVKKKSADATKHVTMKESFQAEEEEEEEGVEDVATKEVKTEGENIEGKKTKSGHWDEISVPHAAEAKKHIHMGKESKSNLETEAKEEPITEAVTINGITFEPINESWMEEGMYEEGMYEEEMGGEEMNGEEPIKKKSSNEIETAIQNAIPKIISDPLIQNVSDKILNDPKAIESLKQFMNMGNVSEEEDMAVKLPDMAFFKNAIHYGVEQSKNLTEGDQGAKIAGFFGLFAGGGYLADKYFPNPEVLEKVKTLIDYGGDIGREVVTTYHPVLQHDPMLVAGLGGLAAAILGCIAYNVFKKLRNK